MKSFVVNTHHLPAAFEIALREVALSRVSRQTGARTGAARNRRRDQECATVARDKAFIVYSGDVLTDLPLEPLIEEHFRSGNDVTLALRETGLATNVAFRDATAGSSTSEIATDTPAITITPMSRSGVRGFSSAFRQAKKSPSFRSWPNGSATAAESAASFRRRSLVESQLAAPNISRSIARLSEESWRPDYVPPSAWPMRIAPDAIIDPSAQVRGCSSIGAGCRIGAGAIVEDSILWPGAQIASRARLKRCIVRTQRSAEGTLTDAVI